MKNGAYGIKFFKNVAVRINERGNKRVNARVNNRGNNKK
ncbi:hypothetical protein HPNQ4216_1666 [Helicobacter pylori NQ4216]|nr:hypothetical protein HPNQ4216_1666 [Helicobacter pylori NQ4216]